MPEPTIHPGRAHRKPSETAGDSSQTAIHPGSRAAQAEAPRAAQGFQPHACASPAESPGSRQLGGARSQPPRSTAHCSGGLPTPGSAGERSGHQALSLGKPQECWGSRWPRQCQLTCGPYCSVQALRASSPEALAPHGSHHCTPAGHRLGPGQGTERPANS